ncbi:augmin complex subunit wac [Rhagoletis pomonella]|uniref:augmin complex subunit wac n=1 Tax=Rhagoletis pomonella TaxID=28610 RepID=UPI00177F1F9F|nr:augmin complex subunit wac [Rhagoletis pomonella]
MDNFQLQDDVQSLQKLREHYEHQLRLMGLELCDLPDDVGAMLEECVALQQVTQLHDLQLEYLKEFYYIKRREHLENNLTAEKMLAEIKEQEKQLQKEITEANLLEKFTTSVNKRLISESEMQRNKILIEGKIQTLKERQSAFNIPDDLNLDELVKKVERLEKTKSLDK